MKKNSSPSKKPIKAQANLVDKGPSASKGKKLTTHAKYRKIVVIQTDGTEFETRSTYKLDKLILEIDVKTHPAWTKQSNYVNTKNNEVAKFQEKFAGLDFL